MTMKPTDKILAPARGTLEGALKAGEKAERHDDFVDYVTTVFNLAPRVGIDPAIVIAQSHVEVFEPSTNTPWGSYWWRTRLNPAGIGITGDPKQNEASRTFKTGEEAARAQVAHLLLYATGKIDRGGLTPDDDPRYAAYKSAFGTKVVATTIAELSGNWAADKSYHTKICARGNMIWPNLTRYETPTPEPETPKYVQPNVIMDEYGSPWIGFRDTIVNKTILYAQRRSITFLREAPAYQYGHGGSNFVREPYQVGDSARVFGYFPGTLNGVSGYWWVTSDYHRVWAYDTFDWPIGGRL